MLDLELPMLVHRPVALELEQRRVRGERRDDQEAPPQAILKGRVSIGGPVAVPVTSTYVAADHDLQAFVEHEANRARYHLVHLAVTFERRGLDDEPLEAASIELLLSSQENAADPIAWSMLPMRITDPYQLTQSVKLGPQLKLHGADVSVGSAERTRSQQHADVFLEALRELRSDPAWQFARTRAIRLSGSHRLVMVVRAARGASVRGAITVKADVRRRRVLSYRAALPNPLRLHFDF